jgi:S-ribosylhomocysteine lyase LuxS involved in autoinducer biosynthesis
VVLSGLIMKKNILKKTGLYFVLSGHPGHESIIKVVKIAIQLVKSYVFTSQYRLYVLNRSQNSEMGKIGSKSGKIVKIG